MRQTKKELFEIIRQQFEVIEYWMEKALEQSELKAIMKPHIIAYPDALYRRFSQDGDTAVQEMLQFLKDNFKDNFKVMENNGTGKVSYHSILSRQSRKLLLIIENHENGEAEMGLLTYPLNKSSVTDIHRLKLKWSDPYGKGHRKKYDYRGKSYKDIYDIFKNFAP